MSRASFLIAQAGGHDPATAAQHAHKAPTHVTLQTKPREQAPLRNPPRNPPRNQALCSTLLYANPSRTFTTIHTQGMDGMRVFSKSPSTSAGNIQCAGKHIVHYPPLSRRRPFARDVSTPPAAPARPRPPARWCPPPTLRSHGATARPASPAPSFALLGQAAASATAGGGQQKRRET